MRGRRIGIRILGWGGVFISFCDGEIGTRELCEGVGMEVLFSGLSDALMCV